MKACFDSFIIRIAQDLKKEYCILDKKFMAIAFQEVLIYEVTSFRGKWRENKGGIYNPNGW